MASSASVSAGSTRIEMGLLRTVTNWSCCGSKKLNGMAGTSVMPSLRGRIVVEKIFAIPGLGWHFVQAALQRDYLLEMGLVLLYTAMLCTMNFLVDLSYAVLDPRVELK